MMTKFRITGFTRGLQKSLMH